MKHIQATFQKVIGGDICGISGHEIPLLWV